MIVLVLQIFVSLVLVAGAVALFVYTVRARTFDHADRLALSPLDDDSALPTPRGAAVSPKSAPRETAVSPKSAPRETAALPRSAPREVAALPDSAPRRPAARTEEERD